MCGNLLYGLPGDLLMRNMILLLLVMLVAFPTMVTGAITDTFSGANGPDQNWYFLDDTGANTETWLNAAPNPYATTGSDTYTVSMNPECNLNGTGTGGYSLNVGGILLDPSNPAQPYAHMSHAYTEMAVNTNPTGNNCVKGLMLYVQQDPLTMYLANYNPWHHLLDIMVLDPVLGPKTMIQANIGTGGAPTILDIELDMKFQAVLRDRGGVPTPDLLAQAWGDLSDGQGYRLLTEVGFRVGVDTPEQGVAPVLSYGGTGFFGQMNSSVVHGGQGGTMDLVDVTYDDFLTRSGLQADFDLDGDVDVSDLGILATNYGILSGMSWSMGDSDLDGDVDVSDLGELATNYGVVVSASAAAVPEPGMLSLLGLGSLVLLLGRRR